MVRVESPMVAIVVNSTFTEHLWDMTVRSISELQDKPQGLQLSMDLEVARGVLDDSEINRVTNSMRQGCEAVIAVREGLTCH